jgi:ABC-type sulfate transport system permease component
MVSFLQIILPEPCASLSLALSLSLSLSRATFSAVLTLRDLLSRKVEIMKLLIMSFF